MTKHSMTISNCAIDRIHVSTTANRLDALKGNIFIVTDGDTWKELPSEGLFQYAAIEESTGIVLMWNNYVEGGKSNLNGKLVCKVVGEYLRKLSLREQLELLSWLSRGCSVSQLDLKFQLNKPVWPIEGLQAVLYETGLEKWPEISYKGFENFNNCISGGKDRKTRPHSVNLTKASTKKIQLFVYDPIEKHGIANAQHWELRLRGDYVKPVIGKLELYRKDVDKAAKFIVDRILSSVDFTYEGKTMPWYRQIKNAPLVM